MKRILFATVLAISFCFLVEAFADDVYADPISSVPVLLASSNRTDAITTDKPCRETCQAQNKLCKDNCNMDNRKCQMDCQHDENCINACGKTYSGCVNSCNAECQKCILTCPKS
jgi:hypothetical protein